MNYLIQYVIGHGLHNYMYEWVNTAALVIALLYSFWHGKKLGIPFWKMLIILAVVYFGMGYIGSGIWSVVQYVREVHFLGIETATNSIVRLFVFLPLLALPAALVLRLKWGHVCDAIAMFPLLKSCVGQLACIFPGCCRGYAWEYGIYNVKTHANHFPIQIVETCLTLLVFICLLVILQDKKYTSDGSLYPCMMIMYGIMRFSCELLRDNEKIIFEISAIAIHAILITIVGGVWILILFQKKEKDYEELEQVYKDLQCEDNQVVESNGACQESEKNQSSEI